MNPPPIEIALAEDYLGPPEEFGALRKIAGVRGDEAGEGGIVGDQFDGVSGRLGADRSFAVTLAVGLEPRFVAFRLCTASTPPMKLKLFTLPGPVFVALKIKPEIINVPIGSRRKWNARSAAQCIIDMKKEIGVPV